LFVKKTHKIETFLNETLEFYQVLFGGFMKKEFRKGSLWVSRKKKTLVKFMK